MELTDWKWSLSDLEGKKNVYPNVDACPGRLNQANLFIKRFGVFFGQCSEMCDLLSASKN